MNACSSLVDLTQFIRDLRATSPPKQITSRISKTSHIKNCLHSNKITLRITQHVRLSADVQLFEWLCKHDPPIFWQEEPSPFAEFPGLSEGPFPLFSPWSSSSLSSSSNDLFLWKMQHFLELFFCMNSLSTVPGCQETFFFLRGINRNEITWGGGGLEELASFRVTVTDPEGAGRLAGCAMEEALIEFAAMRRSHTQKTNNLQSAA